MTTGSEGGADGYRNPGQKSRNTRQSGASQRITLGADGEAELLGLAAGCDETLGEVLGATVGKGLTLCVELGEGVTDGLWVAVGVADGLDEGFAETLGDGLGLALGGSTTSTAIESWLTCDLRFESVAVRVKLPCCLPRAALEEAESSKASCCVWPAFRVRFVV